MFRNRFTISLPQACPESWARMTPQAQGRFCRSCGKTVVDFTAMSDAELSRWLSSHAGTGCGRFREDQLHREFISPKSAPKKRIWKAVAVALVAWLLAKPTAAQPPSRANTPEIQLLPSPALSAIPATPPANNYFLTGTVLAGNLGPSVTLRLNDTVETRTDYLGNFRLPYSKSVPLEKQWLVISAIGYETQRHRLADLALDQPLQFLLALSPQTFSFTGRLGGYVAVQRKWYSPTKLYRKGISFFRDSVSGLFSQN